MTGSFIRRARKAAGRLRTGGALAAGVAAVVLATGGAALASDTAATGKTAATGQIRACYNPGSQPAALKVLTKRSIKCPTGDKGLSWNKMGPQGPVGPQGPQGPAGISTGVTTGHVITIPIDTGPNTPVTVLTAPAVSTSGVYYITVSATVQVAAGDAVACAAIPNQIEAQTAQFGPTSQQNISALVVNGALSLTAGQAPSVICIDANSDSNTEFLQGSLNATLISSSTGPARTRPGRFPLRIVTGAK